MNKDRDVLSGILTVIFKENNYNSKLRMKMEDDLANKFAYGYINDIYNNKRGLHEPTEPQLYLITNFLYNNVDLINNGEQYKRNLEPKQWFTESEIMRANNILIKNKKKDQTVWFEINNVDELEFGTWISSHESYKNLVHNWETGAIYYNPETQREGKIKSVMGYQYTAPKLVDKNVNEIYEAMKDKRFFTNMITLNIQATGLIDDEDIKYYPEERVLRVKKKDDLMVTILDGFHRLSAMIKLINEIPDFEGSMSVRIFNLDIQKAQSLILQESKGTPLGSQTIRAYDIKNKYMQLAKKINDFGTEADNDMYHKMTTVFDEIKKNYKLCLFSNISNGLEDNFADIIENATGRDFDRLIEYIVKFYNEFLGIYKDEFNPNNIKETKKNTTLADINIFSGVLVLARKLYDVEDWKKKLDNILKNVDWDRKAPQWESILTNSLNWNKPVKTKLYNYFEGLTEESVGVDNVG